MKLTTGNKIAIATLIITIIATMATFMSSSTDDGKIKQESKGSNSPVINSDSGDINVNYN